jgi:hypothetical protein
VRRLQEREFPEGTLTLRYRFVHVLYQNALYALLTPARKVSLSIAVAEVLLGYHAEQSAVVASPLALLLEAGRDFARAADFFVVAAQNAARVYANQEAVTLLGRALANADKLRGPSRQARVLATAMQRGGLNETLFRLDDALADFATVEKVAVEMDNREAQINAMCRKGIVLHACHRLDEMQQCANQAAELARLADSRVGLASAEVILSFHGIIIGDLAAAEYYMDRAIPVLQTEGEPLSALDAVCQRAIISTLRLEYETAEPALHWIRTKARDLGTGFRLIHADFMGGMALGNRGRLSEALGVLREGMRLADLHGERGRPATWRPNRPRPKKRLARRATSTRWAPSSTSF